MSTREQAFVKAVKSIQRGTVSATNSTGTANTGTVTVTSVDTSKSILHVNCKNGYGAVFGGTNSTESVGGATLTNSTTITWTGGVVAGVSAGDVSAVLAWQLVEYY